MSDSTFNAAAGQPVTSEPEESGIDFRQYWRTVVNHLWLVVLVTLLVTGGATLWTLRQPKIYAARSSVALDITTPRVLTDVREVVDTGAGGNAFASRGYVDLQLAVLKSKDTAMEIARRLASDPTFVPISERDSAMRWLPNYVQGTLSAINEKDSRIVILSAEDLIPERAARLVNVAAEVFVEMNLNQRMEATLGASDWLVDQVEDLQKQLEKSEVGLQKFKEDHDILSATFEDRQSMNSSELLALSKALTDLRLKKMEMEVRHRQIEKALAEEKAGGFGLRALPQVHTNPIVATRYENLQKLNAERAEALSKYGEQHPKIQSMERQLAMEEEELRKDMLLIVEVEKRTYEQLIETEKVYTAALDSSKQQAFEVNRNEVAYKRLSREVTNNERLYEMVLKRQKEADLSSALKFNNMRVIDRAEPAKMPVRPNNARNVMFGLLIGLMLGVALAFLIEFLDNTIKSQDDIENRLGMVFLGVMPSIKQKEEEKKAPKDGKERNPERDLHVHLQPKSPAAECCRAIRTNLLFMAPDAPLRTMLVTSPGPSDGKTTTAVSLSIAMAQSGGKTLLIDTDMRRPRIHKSFQLSNEVGLTSVLVGDAELKDAIKSTEVPGLYVLPCGPIPPNPAELLHTERFRETLARLQEQFDKVILDSPPVGAVTDPLILSSYVGGVVIAVRCNKTARDVAARTRRALMDVNARILGVVLNDLDLERRDGYYTYYPARYGYTYGDPEPAKSKPEAA